MAGCAGGVAAVLVATPAFAAGAVADVGLGPAAAAPGGVDRLTSPGKFGAICGVAAGPTLAATRCWMRSSAPFRSLTGGVLTIGVFAAGADVVDVRGGAGVERGATGGGAGLTSAAGTVGFPAGAGA